MSSTKATWPSGKASGWYGKQKDLGSSIPLRLSSLFKKLPSVDIVFVTSSLVYKLMKR